MNKKKNISSIVRLMHNLMLSAKAHDPHPWLHLELTREQMRVIFLLFFKGRASPGEVAGSFGVPKANVTSVIDRLVGKGLVSRQENPQDRRGYILSLTDEGKRQVEKLWEMRIARFERTLDGMTEEALDSLRRGLEAFIRVLKEESETDGHNQGR